MVNYTLMRIWIKREMSQQTFDNIAENKTVETIGITTATTNQEDNGCFALEPTGYDIHL